ncbi:hypothetical protein KVR01_007955 [Diaporthe batatas]|uniref:uncharacterized protein n=1 Tax=Diaporthe batatas TaxID=748121 RepID=UPI001D0455DE|nr:uncharacterized protein KVR01_007955 [Diaporthe batatas]KAG8162190.1 hypothetical protein KVR01_007955 [Diaporthe batatas]
MYALRVIIATLFAVTASASVVERQLGGIGCNIARFQILGALGDTGDAISEIEDADVQAAAQAGLDQANGGISQIASSLLSGGAPPADSRDEVEAGLTAMASALADADESDAAVGDAKTALADATAAGQDVVAKC